MTKEFDRIVAQMPDLLRRLQSGDLLSRDNIGDIPQRGIYILYEKGKPIYVGRSRRLKQRLQEHSRDSSRHESGTFAFNLAKAEAIKKGIHTSRTRKQLQNDPEFEQVFLEAKKRVSRMKIRVVEVEEPALQTVFEVYVALTLETPYNAFETS